MVSKNNKKITKKSSAVKKSGSTNSKYDKDSTFFLKLVIFLVLGSQWVYIQGADWQLPIPVGLVIGLVFATHEHFQIDRKIEYAVLITSMFISFWIPNLGVIIQV